MIVVLSPKIKYIVTPAVGFGLAGLIWGWEAYRGTVGAGETFTNPFSYILGAVAFGILGSLSLVLFSGDKKKILKVVGFGLVGWIVAFLVPVLFQNQFFLIGGGLLSFIFLTPLSFLFRTDLVVFANLKPSLMVGHLWVEFLMTGLAVILIYSLLLKMKVRKVIFFSAIIFGLMAVISPILGNLLGGLSNSLFFSYIFTFCFIGIILGLLLGRVVLYQKE